MSKIKKKIISQFSNDKGMSLLEVLVSIMLIGIMATTFLNMFLYAFDLSLQSQTITNHTYAAQAVVENVRNNDYRQLQQLSTAKQEYDSNGDGVNDCYVQTTFEPYGIEMKQNASDPDTTSDAVYLHLIYYGFDLMVIAPDGSSLFYEDINNVNNYQLVINSNNTLCTFSIGTEVENRLDFYRDNIDSKVVVVINLDLKEASYTNGFYVQDQISNATSDATIKLLGNPTIAGTSTTQGTVTFPRTQPDERYMGIMNLSSSLVKVTVDIFKDNTSTIPSIRMSEILEISNGEPDSLVGP